MKKFTKSQQQVLDAIDGKCRIVKTLKRHTAAAEELKRRGIITKDANSILRRAKKFGMNIPVQVPMSRRWATAVWRRKMNGTTVAEVAYTAWGDSREESMRRADIILELLQSGTLI